MVGASAEAVRVIRVCVYTQMTGYASDSVGMEGGGFIRVCVCTLVTESVRVISLGYGVGWVGGSPECLSTLWELVVSALRPSECLCTL